MSRTDDPVTVTYAPTASELVAAIRARTWTPLRVALLSLVAIFGVVSALALNLPLLWFIAVAVLGVVIGEELRARAVATKQAAAAAAHGPTRYEFGDTGIHCERPGHLSDYSWAELDRAEESTRFIFLVFPNTFALMIPKERLSGSDLARLRSRLKDRLRSKARLA